MKTRDIEGYIQVWISTKQKEDQDSREALVTEFINNTPAYLECIAAGDFTPKITWAGPWKEEQ